MQKAKRKVGYFSPNRRVAVQYRLRLRLWRLSMSFHYVAYILRAGQSWKTSRTNLWTKQGEAGGRENKVDFKKRVNICKRGPPKNTLHFTGEPERSYSLFCLCSLLSLFSRRLPCLVLPCPSKCIKNADTAERQSARHSHVQISTCQFMIMAPREARQNVNYTPTDEMKLGRITS